MFWRHAWLLLIRRPTPRRGRGDQPLAVELDSVARVPVSVDER
jgi:hypothetical protein